QRQPLLRSRLALAASVACLTSGVLFLAGAFQERPTTAPAGVQLNGAGADSRYDAGREPTPPPSDGGTPSDSKVVNETLIQGPSGTSYHVIIVHP
ncbi:MAG TPA: hypothetical protein VMS17_08340, partial [Gemmataceae bacterium]|nr:hypothetical protein [Gemmataceae bacterium]